MPSDKPYDETIDVPDSEDIATPRPQKAVYDSMEEFEGKSMAFLIVTKRGHKDHRIF